MTFSKLAGGPNLADSFFQMAPDDDPDKFFCVSGSAGDAGGGSSKQMEKKKGGEDYNSEEYIHLHQKIGVVTTYLASIRQL